MNRRRKFLSSEIEIEFKSALYFYTILFFYFACKLLGGSLQADIIIIVEMIIATYLMGFVQVFLLGNFDEAEHISVPVILKAIGCSAIYAVISYLGGWFDRSPIVTLIFFLFMPICYGCVYWLYSVRRKLTTKHMNEELAAFKQQHTRRD